MIKTDEQKFFFKLADKLGVTLNNMKAAIAATEAEMESEEKARSAQPIAEGASSDDSFTDTGITSSPAKTDESHDPDLHSHGNEVDSSLQKAEEFADDQNA